MALHIAWCHSTCEVSAMVTMVWFVCVCVCVCVCVRVCVGWWSCLIFKIDVEIIEAFGNVRVIIIMCDVVDEVRRLGGLCAE